MIRIVAAPALFLILTAPPTAEGAAPQLRALFPKQAEIAAPGSRLVRLELPPEVTAACRPDLSDLRILDAEGRETAYLIDSGPPPSLQSGPGAEGDDGQRLLTRTVLPEIAGAAREEVAREGAPNLRRESYRLRTPESVSMEGSWDLVVESPAPSFVRRAEAREASGNLLAEGSFFRLRQPLRERLRLALPEVPRELTVILEGEEGFYLEPQFRFETSRALAAAARSEIELREVSLLSRQGRTTLLLERPRGLVPDFLRFATTTPAFHREVQVWDAGPGAVPRALGEGQLFRVPASAPVEQLELPISAPGGDRLRLVVADADSPPLENLTVRAVVRRPALVFSLAGAGEVKATLVFGGGRAWRPKYDLANLPSPSTDLRGADAEVGQRLYDRALLAPALLGPVIDNPAFDPAPLLAFAQRPGGELDTRPFQWRRDLTVGPSPEGLARLVLGVEDLAKARGDLADLRIVDDQDRQWAWLSAPGSDEEVRRLELSPPRVKDGASHYLLRPPVTPARLSRLELDSELPFFDREFELRGRLGKDEATLARGRLARRFGDPRPVEIACPAQAVDELELIVRDGDDAPIPWSGAEAYFPVPALYFPVPAGDYALLMGDPRAEAPRYELERIRNLILGVAAIPVQASPIRENPAYSSRAWLASGQGLQQVLLWVALAAAVAVLSLLTLRMVRRGESQ